MLDYEKKQIKYINDCIANKQLSEALFYAVLINNSYYFNQLIDNPDVDVNFNDAPIHLNLCKPLSEAIKNQNVDFVKKLLEHGAIIRQFDMFLPHRKLVYDYESMTLPDGT
jgi:hypothetical protein